MNPDKLFDYLDGRLTATERAALERQLISDPQLQRELAIAREIHAGMRGPGTAGREIFLPTPADVVAARGRKIALRVGAVFIILMAVNVGVGLWLIVRHETKNPNRALLETQMRQQITKALEHAATTITPAPLGVSEITVPATAGTLQDVADRVTAIAAHLGGSATKGLADQHRVNVVVDLPPNRESEFRAEIAAIAGGKPGSPTFAEATPGKPTPAVTKKKSFIVQVVEASPE
jgi:hypothetical protein